MCKAGCLKYYHVVLYINSERAKAWSDLEVVERWHSMFQGNSFSNKFLKGDSLLPAEQVKFNETIAEWRLRLHDISWFMRIINEYIAREANKEDECTGRFWEGRFRSQALLDEAALIACMAYVDLNPIRAKMAKTPETSDHTSIKKRCAHAKKIKANKTDKNQQTISAIRQQVKGLHPFVGNPRQKQPFGIQMKLSDYMELVDCTGRILRENKRGIISAKSESILARLHLEKEQWLEIMTHFEVRFSTFVGGETAVRTASKNLDYQRPPNLRSCQQLFN